jgi:hypothetical protein
VHIGASYGPRWPMEHNLLAVAHNEHNEYPLTVLMQGKVQ